MGKKSICYKCRYRKSNCKKMDLRDDFNTCTGFRIWDEPILVLDDWGFPIDETTTDTDAADQTTEYVAAILRKAYPNGDPDFIPDLINLMDLHSRKNYDYAHGGSPLGNFDRVSNILSNYPKLKHTPDVVAMIYALKQIDAVLHAISEGYNPKVEGLDERFRDIVVYFELARIMNRKQAMKDK